MKYMHKNAGYLRDMFDGLKTHGSLMMLGGGLGLAGGTLAGVGKWMKDAPGDNIWDKIKFGLQGLESTGHYANRGKGYSGMKNTMSTDMYLHGLSRFSPHVAAGIKFLREDFPMARDGMYKAKDMISEGWDKIKGAFDGGDKTASLSDMRKLASIGPSVSGPVESPKPVMGKSGVLEYPTPEFTPPMISRNKTNVSTVANTGSSFSGVKDGMNMAKNLYNSFNNNMLKIPKLGSLREMRKEAGFMDTLKSTLEGMGNAFGGDLAYMEPEMAEAVKHVDAEAAKEMVQTVAHNVNRVKDTVAPIANVAKNVVSNAGELAKDGLTMVFEDAPKRVAKETVNAAKGLAGSAGNAMWDLAKCFASAHPLATYGTLAGLGAYGAYKGYRRFRPKPSVSAEELAKILQSLK